MSENDPMEFKNKAKAHLRKRISFSNRILSQMEFLWILSSFLLFLPACNTHFEALDKEGPDVLPAIAKKCDSDSNSQVCIYLKNPFSGNSQVSNISSLKPYQTLGVQIPSLINSEVLESSQFSIKNASLQTPQSVHWKTYSKSSTQNLSHIIAYYHLQSFRNFIASYFGSYAADNIQIPIYTDSYFSGFSSKKNEIHLLQKALGTPMAADGSIVIHYGAQSLIHTLSNGALSNNANINAQTCMNNQNKSTYAHCCQSAQGCGTALKIASADYLSALFFESIGKNSGFSEMWHGDPLGIKHCNIYRNIDKQNSLTFSIAHNACASRGSTGWSYPLATAYAAAWWSVRAAVSNKKALDEVFFKHISQLQSSDTFRTALNKALTIDQNQYQSQFQSLLNSEFQRRQLP